MPPEFQGFEYAFQRKRRVFELAFLVEYGLAAEIDEMANVFLNVIFTGGGKYRVFLKFVEL